MNKEKRNIVLSFLLLPQIGLVYVLSNFPEGIDQIYSNGIYMYISTFLRTIFGWIPFSIGDILYITLIFLIFNFFYRFIKNKNNSRKKLVFKFFAGVSIFYFCFYFFWGLNYSRQPLTHSLDLKKNTTLTSTDKYDIEKLTELSEKLIFNINELHHILTIHDTLAVTIPYSKSEILSKTSMGYQNLGEKFSQFQYSPISLKKSLISVPLTYMGFAGYLNPLTGEAQVDYLIPKIGLPSTCSHEVAHQLGIASENEANFIGFLAASHHDDKYFQYSAYLMAFRYTLFDLYRYDPNIYKDYLNKLPKGVLKNLKETEDFWKDYENPLEPIFKIFYDNFLKANQQKDGLKSYNKMVDLLIAYDDKYSLD